MITFFLLYFFVTCSVRVVFSVADSTDNGIDNRDMNNYGKLASEVTTVKNTMKVLSDQWEKWNTLFITSLEPRITSIASTLSSIDSNVHNLQERAHVWDTFQLHVAAWNDQLASLDRKMAILSKGMEQVLVIDSKLNSMLSAEYKLDTLIKMVNSLTGSILNIKQFCQSSRNTLLEEFAVRGILSSLKLVERKMDKLLLARPSFGIKTASEENSAKCIIPKTTEDLLNDISSKVDIIFDSVYKKNENDYPEEYFDGKDNEGSGSTESPANIERTIAVKRGLHLFQNNACCKYTDQTIKELKKYMSNINTNLVSFTNKPNRTSKACDKDDIEEILKNFTQSFSVDQTINMNLILESYFNEHRAHLSTMLERFHIKGSVKPKDSDTIPTMSIGTDEITTLPTLDASTFTEKNLSPNDSEYDMKTKLFLKDSTLSKAETIITVEDNKRACDNLDDKSSSGIYIFLKSDAEFDERFFNKQLCEVREDGPWTVIQRRDNYSIQHDFNVSWNDYKLGFGDLHEDFWIGNNYLARLSKTYNLTLRIELGDFVGNEVWAEYKTFSVDTQDKQFKLSIGGYSGNSSDALSSHNGAPFSTFDRKNDRAPECCPCSLSYGGGWWFTRCFESNLNGIYYRNPYENDYFRGIIWEHWLGNYSLKKSRMMIKSTGFSQLYMPNVTRIEDP